MLIMFIILITCYVSISVFASSGSIPVNIKNSAIKICAITADIKQYESINYKEKEEKAS